MTTRVIHLPVSYLPWTVGGKEVYCHTLCRELIQLDVESMVVIHQDPSGREPVGRHRHEGIPVVVLPTIPGCSSREAFYTREYASVPGFAALLDEVKPDLVHFHDQGGGASLSHLKAVKQRGLPAVLTYHSPGQTCPQRALLRYGRVPCDGEVRLRRCTACRLTANGLPRLASELVALAEWPGFNPWSSGVLSRLLTARNTTRLFRRALDEFVELADAIIVLAQWSREIWRRNGCPAEKLHLIRTGGPAPYSGARGPRYPERKPLRVACLGRCTWVKGFHVLVEAVQRMPEAAPIEVHFLGPYWKDAYGQGLLQRIMGDPRFVAPRVVPNAELLPVLAEMDVMVIPSLWLETGPLTLFDAFAAGIPVIASRLGGLAELVVEEKNGVLFSPGDSAALAKALQRFVESSDNRSRIAPASAGARTMQSVALEMHRFYESLIRDHASRKSAVASL